MRTSYFIALLCVLFILPGCPGGDDDDVSGDDDTGDDDAGDDDTDNECTTAESCADDYDITSESELEAIAQCESIEGYLWFHEHAWLTSIDLPCLTTVGGGLDIEGNASLTTLDMPSLTTVGDDLYIWDNDALTSLGGLPGLTTVGGYLDISLNDCLSQADAEAFAAGLTVGFDVVVEDNGANYPCN